MDTLDAFSLLNVVFVVVLLAAWWAFYDAAHRPPDAEQDASPMLAMSGMVFGATPLAPSATMLDGLDRVLNRIGGAGGFATVSEFLRGAKQAYELILPAVAQGNPASVDYLLTEQVRQDFQTFADARRQRGETESLMFIGFSGVDVIAASFDDVASVDVRFSADIVSATRDRDGNIIQGSADRVVRVAEIWTFERDLKSPRSRWRLAATDADE